VRALIVLAHDRAITTAVVVAGDEDLVEGVAEAQERGVRVVGLGVVFELVIRWQRGRSIGLAHRLWCRMGPWDCR
jgi:hypothetical protein